MSRNSEERGAIAVGPLLVWLILQLLSLVLAAARVPLAALYLQPAELQAVRLMLAAQLGGSSLLFPSLLKNCRTAFAAASASIVMLSLAAMLATWPILNIAPLAGLVVLWLFLLATLGALLPKGTLPIASAVVTTYVVGGAFLWYLRAEFGAGEPVGQSGTYGPLCSVLTSPASVPNPVWWGIVGTDLALLFALITNQFRKLKRV